MIREDVLDAHELRAAAEMADHKLRVPPPRLLVHVEVRARQRRGPASERSLAGKV